MVGGFGGMLSFELKGGYDAAYRAIRRTEVCILAVSLGGVETLITHPASLVYPHNTDEERRVGGVSPGVIKLGGGTEEAKKITAKLDGPLGSKKKERTRKRKPTPFPYNRSQESRVG